MTISEIISKLHVINTITESARWSDYSNKIDVNMSTIYTKLIKDAARCNCYSSDLLYDIQAFEDRLKTCEPGAVYMGFRKNGVDGENFIVSRCANGSSVYNEYFALYKLELCPDEDDSLRGLWWNIVLTEYAV